MEKHNDLYYTPAFNVITELYMSGSLSEDYYFDQELEWEFYEFWHHEGRRARRGTAMMASD